LVKILLSHIHSIGVSLMCQNISYYPGFLYLHLYTRSADAEPEADADAFYGYYGYARPYGYGYRYGGYRGYYWG